MRRLITLILMAIFIGFGLMFGTLNETSVSVDYFFLKTEWPLALSLMSFFAVGVATGGVFVYLAMWFGLRQRVREMKRQHKKDSGGENQPRVAALTSDE